MRPAVSDDHQFGRNTRIIGASRTGLDSSRCTSLRGGARNALLEVVLQAELNYPFGWVVSVVAGRSDFSRQRVGRREHVGIVKLRMIEGIEKFRPQLHFVAFPDTEK